MARYRQINHPRGLFGQDVHDVTVLGAVAKSGCGDKAAPPELLYAVTKRRPLAKTHNLIQWSGQILGLSKNLLFSKVLAFLRYFRADSLEILYCGKSKTLCGGGGVRDQAVLSLFIHRLHPGRRRHRGL
jgi:hypothetical protein